MSHGLNLDIVSSYFLAYNQNMSNIPYDNRTIELPSLYLLTLLISFEFHSKK